MKRKKVEAFFDGYAAGFTAGRRRMFEEILLFLQREKVKELERAIKQYTYKIKKRKEN